MAIVSYIDFVNNYLIKNGLIGNATNMNKAADQLKKEIDEVIAGNKGTDILTKLKTVDGTGSGLDADLLDGKDSATTNIVNTIVARDGTGNFSAGTITAALTGNASTASKLQTARTINGEAFDGSANITVSDSTAVKLTGNQTVAGIKTFTSSPIVPTPTTGTQAVNKDYADLKVALTAFTGANVNLATSGYQKLPGGLIIQWGTAVSISNAGGGSVLTYPITFPNNGFKPIICNGDNNQTALFNLTVIDEQVSSSGFGWAISVANELHRINWIAIGY